MLKFILFNETLSTNIEYCGVSTAMMNLLKGTCPYHQYRVSEYCLLDHEDALTCMPHHGTSFSSTLIESTKTNHQKPPQIQVA